MTKRLGAAVLGGVVSWGLLVGCGGSDGDSDTEDEPTSASSATGGTTTEPVSGYLPVPTDVTLTEPGATLALGDQATIAWRPRQDTVVALELTVERIDETSFEESFEGWVVTKEMRGQVPYFVRVTSTNVSDMGIGDLLVPLYALSSAGSMYEPLDFREEIFEPCPGGELPDRLGSGKSAELCFVYLLPEGHALTAAAFDPVGELEPITWRGEITEIEKPRDKKGKKKDRKKRDAG